MITENTTWKNLVPRIKALQQNQVNTNISWVIQRSPAHYFVQTSHAHNLQSYLSPSRIPQKWLPHTQNMNSIMVHGIGAFILVENCTYQINIQTKWGTMATNAKNYYEILRTANHMGPLILKENKRWHYFKPP